MPVLVHIADVKNVASIRRNGIATGKERPVVYFMPVTQNHLVSHQWLRELRRGGARTLVAVNFRLSDSEPVWFGDYRSQHRQLPLGQAIRDFLSVPDQLGHEFFVDHRIAADQVVRIRNLPQTVGWRYFPGSHGRAPCPCPACLRRGERGSARIRAKDPPAPKPTLAEVRDRIGSVEDPYEIADLLWSLHGKRRRADPSFLEQILRLDDSDSHELLARVLPFFRHRATAPLLIRLCSHPDASVRGSAAKSLVSIDRASGLRALGRLRADRAIADAIAEHGATRR